MSHEAVADRGDQALERFAGIWLRRKRLALGLFTLAFVPAATFVWSLPGIYEASATLIPAGAGEPMAGGGWSAATSLDAVSEQVLSRDNLVAIIDRLGLFAALRAKATPDALSAAMRENIKIEPRQSSDRGMPELFAFTVSYSGSDAATTAAVANTLAHSYQNVAAQMQSQAASDAVKALEGRLAVIQDKLSREQRQIDDFRTRHLGELPEQQQTTLAALERADAQLRDNQSNQLSAMRNRSDILAQMNAAGETDLPRLEQKLAALRMRYTEEYPDVQQLEAQIAALRKQDAGGAGSAAVDPSPLRRQLLDVNANLDALKSQEKTLRARVAAYQKQLDAMPITQQNLQALTRGYGETNDVYAALLKRYEQARIAEATASKNGPQFVVLESAVAPRSPAGPSRMRALVLVLLLCAGLAAGGAMLAERRDTSFHGLDELREFTSVPVLATVPLIHTRRDSVRRHLRAVLAALALVSVAGVLAAGSFYVGHGNIGLSQTIVRHGS